MLRSVGAEFWREDQYRWVNAGETETGEHDLLSLADFFGFLSVPYLMSWFVLTGNALADGLK
jgi:hypothetical protein